MTEKFRAEYFVKWIKFNKGAGLVEFVLESDDRLFSDVSIITKEADRFGTLKIGQKVTMVVTAEERKPDGI